MRRVRFTVRQMMLGVACFGLLWLAAHEVASLFEVRARHLQTADYHAEEARKHQKLADFSRERAESLRPAIAAGRAAEGAEDALKHMEASAESERHAERESNALRARHEQAFRYPWFPVAPDPR
jgi:hypothetical protein